jgi:hypothetical protein
MYAGTPIYSGKYFVEFLQYNEKGRGRDISVGIATGYGLDGPGIECR